MDPERFLCFFCASKHLEHRKHLTNACYFIGWNDKLQAYFDLHLNLFLKIDFFEDGEGDMILDWQEGKKTCPEKIHNVDPPNSGKISFV